VAQRHVSQQQANKVAGTVSNRSGAMMRVVTRTALPTLVSALFLSTLVFAGGPIADSVQPLGQASAQQTAPLTLGRFSLASFDGFVSLQNSGNDLIVDAIVGTDVLVGNRVMPGGRAVPSEKIQVWMLLAQGKTAALRKKEPPPGQGPTETCTGGCEAHVMFTFEKVDNPVAVVSKWDDQLQVFPIATPPK
jgi:hypothetical protein